MTPLADYFLPIQLIVDALQPVLVFFHDLVGYWGWSIVLMTVVVRALLLPLTIKQFKSMQAMVMVAPQLKKLQEKYKDDKQRQQQEVMKFYSENKINPFASCLPLVAQLPFFLGLFYLLQSDLRAEICGKAAGAAVEVAGKLPPCGEVPGSTGQEFLFIPDLTASATGWVLAVLMVLYIGSQLLSSILTPSSGDRTQRLVIYALPLVFGIFILFYDFPAGLLVYWITTNLWTVGQGYIMRRRLGPMTPPGAAPGEAPRSPAQNFFAKVRDLAGSPAKEPAPAPAAAAAVKVKAGVKGGVKAGVKAGPPRTATPAGPSGPPPRPPRKKKKRSGRRR